MQITVWNMVSSPKTRTPTWSKLAVQIILKKVVNLRSRLELRKLLQLSCSRAFPGMAKRSTISLFFLLNVIVFMLPSILIAQRCDRQVYSNIWHRCTECNINVLQGCPIGYQQVTSGEGVQRCTIFLNFGPNLGRISVPGCQHLCRRTLILKECCSGFWGQDCQGILQWNLSVKSYNSNTQITLVVQCLHCCAVIDYVNTDSFLDFKFHSACIFISKPKRSVYIGYEISS